MTVFGLDQQQQHYLGRVCHIGGEKYSLTHKGIDSNYQQDTFKRSDLGVTECSAILVKTEVDVH